jgi:hypothetical protein
MSNEREGNGKKHTSQKVHDVFDSYPRKRLSQIARRLISSDESKPEEGDNLSSTVHILRCGNSDMFEKFGRGSRRS